MELNQLSANQLALLKQVYFFFLLFRKSLAVPRRASGDSYFLPAHCVTDHLHAAGLDICETLDKGRSADTQTKFTYVLFLVY